MFNRIRISTTLFLILVVCGLLQVGSNGLSFWAFRDGQHNLSQVEQGNLQLSSLMDARVVLLQASTALNKAGTLTALSYPPEEIKKLMVSARQNLKQADKEFAEFLVIPPVNDEAKTLLAQSKQRYADLHAALESQATWLESNQLSDFMTAPVPAAQEAFDANYHAWQQNIGGYVQDARRASDSNYHRSAAIFIAMVVIAALLTSGALLWTRRMIVQPLNIISSHFTSIAQGNLARPVMVFGKNEISAIFAGLKAMQTSLRDTVSQVRQGSHAMHTGISEIAAGNNDLSARTEEQAASLAQTAASMEQLTATVGQNADNARQASGLASTAAETAKRGGQQASNVAETMHEIANSSKKIGDITSVIDGIAFQTNILALNAAVEGQERVSKGVDSLSLQVKCAIWRAEVRRRRKRSKV
jgi:methyl-accepting chemotaxis protein-4 (peptide sensor receptor)